MSKTQIAELRQKFSDSVEREEEWEVFYTVIELFKKQAEQLEAAEARIAENAELRERLDKPVVLPKVYWTFDDDKKPTFDADEVISAIQAAGFKTADGEVNHD